MSEYRVTIKLRRDRLVTATISAGSQAEADRKALKAYYSWDGDEDFPPGWIELEPIFHDAEIDDTFCCVDCGEDKEGHYYMVSDALWAAAGAGNGMLCLACLEGRIGRPLEVSDFTAMLPSATAWDRHLAERAGVRAEPEQIDMFGERRCGE